MSSKKEDVPAIRFKEFTDAWKRWSLGDLGNFKSSSVDKVIRPNENKVYLLNYLNVYKGEEIIEKNLVFNSASLKQTYEFDIRKSDVFFTPSSETIMDIGYAKTALKTIEKAVFSYHLVRFRPNCNIFVDSYIDNIVQTSKYRQIFQIEAQGVQRFFISLNNFNNIEMWIPKITEQGKITSLFTSLNTYLSLLQRKYNFAILTVFVFKICFFDNKIIVFYSEMTFVWKRWSLGEITNIFTGEFVNKNLQRDNYKFPVYNGGIENTGFYKNYNQYKDKIIIAARGAAGWINYVDCDFWAGNSVYSLDSIDKNINNYLIYLSLKYKQNELIKKSNTTTIPSILITHLNGFKIHLPKTFDEQIFISNTFKFINSYLSLLQRNKVFVIIIVKLHYSLIIVIIINY
ncbi:restriction endonuclease S subunit [Mycoplasmopsis mustelae]|uniref:Restriction endonuclease S subunit n=1 Tax=Mycoplasmopsis mustelae TaxID=171289 RepID=A0A4R7UES9_9BACT|nr:restriction endonuclease subunit S [Mycoplasmopsis mustelae]TDV24144.1 restriction endonuclease S subunit [Mycoplasmopsis mustelae]